MNASCHHHPSSCETVKFQAEQFIFPLPLAGEVGVSFSMQIHTVMGVCVFEVISIYYKTEKKKQEATNYRFRNILMGQRAG